MRSSSFFIATLAVAAYGAPLQPTESPNELLAPRDLQEFDIGRFLRKLGPLGDAVQRVVSIIPLGLSQPNHLGKRDEKQSRFALDIAELVKTLGPLGESINKLVETIPVAVEADTSILPENKDGSAGLELGLGPAKAKINKREEKKENKDQLALDLGELLKVLGPVGDAIDKVFESVPADISIDVPVLPGSTQGAPSAKVDAGPVHISGKREANADQGEKAGTALNLGDLLKVLGPLGQAVDDLMETIPAKISTDAAVIPGNEKGDLGVKADLGPVDASVSKRDNEEKQNQKGNLAVSLGDLLNALGPVGESIDELIEVIPVDASVAVPVLPKDKDGNPVVSVDAGPVKAST